MATSAASIFCLTYGLVEANQRGWGSPEIVALFTGAVAFAGLFALSQRYGRYPMLTRALVENRQFMGASTAFLLFAIGMMGSLFMTVLAFVNLWGYSELEAAFAITPIPVMGLVVAPVVGRLANRVSPRAVGAPALVVMAAGLLLLSTLPAEASSSEVFPALVLMGAAMGAVFPAINIGAMGSIRGQGLGLGSGIVNMSRQVGFAIGVALLVAVFTGTLDDGVREVGARLADAEEVRDSYAAAFRVAALVTLLAIPFSLLMRSRPADVATAAGAAAG
jgi:MFS family permease